MTGKRKNRKPAARSVRGFATVSVPSKSQSASLEQTEASTPDQPQSVTPDASTTSVINSPAAREQEKALVELSPEELEQHLEQAALRVLVDKHASTIKGDAAKQVLRLQNERRQLRQQAERASFAEPDDELVKLVMSDYAAVSGRHFTGNRVQSLSKLDPDDQVLKLWAVREVLRLLEMPRLDDVLRYISSMLTYEDFLATTYIPGLQEAFLWYASNVPDDELPNYETGTFAVSEVKHEIDTNSDAQLPESHRSTTEKELPSTRTSKEQDRDLETEESSTGSEDDDDNPDQLVDRWLNLQQKILIRSNQRLPADQHVDTKIARYDAQARSIERDILFDSTIAKARWQPLQRALQIQIGQAEKSTRAASKPEREELHDDSTEQDMFENDGALGDLFESVADETATSEDAENGTSMTIRDFGTWKGLAPQRVLLDAAKDKFQPNGMRYISLSATNYSSRLQLQLRWHKNPAIDEHGLKSLPDGVHFHEVDNTWQLRMVSVATRTAAQSESFLATVALSLLMSTSFVNASTLQRLPKTWRQLCQDLHSDYLELIAQEDTKILKHIRDILSSTHALSASDGSLAQDIPKQSRSDKPITADVHNRPMVQDTHQRWCQKARSAAFQRMLAVRQQLPVYAYKHSILETFEDNNLFLVCADTGAGKSTQIPSYLLEHHLSRGIDFNILVTQPRKISAISLARRVSNELGEDDDAIGTRRSVVGYTVRMDSKLSSSTRLTFATTGVLLRMIQESADLDHVDCLVLDEVHERTMEIDLLFIALKKLQQRRPGLKIVLMSATVNAAKFSSYFDKAPVLEIPGRTFPVEVCFLEDAIEETLNNFGAADNGVSPVEQQDYLDEADSEEVDKDQEEDLSRYNIATRNVLSQYNHTKIDYNLLVKLASVIATKPSYQTYSNAILIFMPGIAEIRRLHNLLLATKIFQSRWTFHLLHSSFSTQELELAFRQPSPGYRKIVIATNIAETAITIPDVTAVIDTCREKVMRFEERRQISRLTEGLISRASARQRRGRAARVRAGLCFHLVTRYRFEIKMQESTTPEMLRLSLQEPIMRIKVWGLGQAEEVLAAAIDPPSSKNVRRALARLQDVGAINKNEQLTTLGRQLAKLPLDVTLAKMAVYGVLFRCIDAIVTVIASFFVKEIFDKQKGSASRAAFAQSDSDLLAVVHAHRGWQKARQAGAGTQFCHKYYLNVHALQQLEEQKTQIYVYLADSRMIILNDSESAMLRRPNRAHGTPISFEAPTRYNDLPFESIAPMALAISLYPKLLRKEGNSYRNVFSNQELRLASTSVNLLGNKSPTWLYYFEAMQAKNGRLDALLSSKLTHMILLLAIGHAEFRFFAGVIEIDGGRVRLGVRSWRNMIVLMYLRCKLNDIVTRFVAEIPLSDSDKNWLGSISIMLGGIPSPN